MKNPSPKLSRKLSLNRETLRSLERIELAHVGGGGYDTGNVNCPAAVVIKPPGG